MSLDPLLGKVAHRCEDCQEKKQTDCIQYDLANGSSLILQFGVAVLAAVSMERCLSLLRARRLFAY
jgi:hypothetical protein